MHYNYRVIQKLIQEFLNITSPHSLSLTPHLKCLLSRKKKKKGFLHEKQNTVIGLVL